MRATARPRVKICCIGSIEEALLAIDYGASALGLVSRMPSGPGVVPDDVIAQIAATVPPGVATFLLTSETDVSAIVEQQRRTGVNTLQLVDSLPLGTHQDLRKQLPGISLVQVIHVRSEASFDTAVSVAPHVDGILLDSGNPDLVIKELGGTGRVHDWEISQRIRERIDRPIFLAGGLRAENVGDAIRQVGPFGLDLCNGVRTAGKLDAPKLAAFFQEVACASIPVAPPLQD
jgi:phosphoribosylanthranilate isomerase